MTSLPIVAGAMVIFVVAYLTYGRWLAKTWGIDERARTPAHLFEDGRDFIPASRFTVFSHQFSSIAGAGPVTGPIIGAMFGWGPALAWIVLGGIFFGAVHDFATLYASVKNQGKSMGMLIDQYVGKTGRRLFLLFCWLYTLLLLAAFADIIANTLSGLTKDGAANVPGAQAATISLLYTVVAMGFGLFIRKCRPAETVKLPVAIVLIVGIFVLGMGLPLFFDAQTWRYLTFGYCFIAAVLPMWLLKAPRDYLCVFLFLGMVFGGVIGLLAVNPALNMPVFVGFEVNGKFLFPILFITIACSAVSGFHSLVSAGRSSKIIGSERDMLPIGYGAMLMESLLGVVALVIACAGASDGTLPQGTPFQIFAGSIGGFFRMFGFSAEASGCIITMCLASLAMTTIDASARVGRMTFQEFFKPEEGKEAGLLARLCMNPYFATAGTLVPAYILCIAGYMSIWPLFGAANQLLASLVLITLAIFMRATGRKGLMLYIPMTFMFVVTMATLALSAYGLVVKLEHGTFVPMVDGLQLVLAIALMVLAALMVRECRRELVLQAVVIGSVIFTVIVGSVFTYYDIIYKETYRNIVRDGEVDAWKTADRLDQYLAANVDAIKLSAYTLEEMLKDQKTDDECAAAHRGGCKQWKLGCWDDSE